MRARRCAAIEEEREVLPEAELRPQRAVVEVGGHLVVAVRATDRVEQEAVAQRIRAGRSWPQAKIVAAASSRRRRSHALQQRQGGGPGVGGRLVWKSMSVERDSGIWGFRDLGVRKLIQLSAFRSAQTVSLSRLNSLR